MSEHNGELDFQGLDDLRSEDVKVNIDDSHLGVDERMAYFVDVNGHYYTVNEDEAAAAFAEKELENDEENQAETNELPYGTHASIFKSFDASHSNQADVIDGTEGAVDTSEYQTVTVMSDRNGTQEVGYVYVRQPDGPSSSSSSSLPSVEPGVARVGGISSHLAKGFRLEADDEAEDLGAVYDFDEAEMEDESEMVGEDESSQDIESEGDEEVIKVKIKSGVLRRPPQTSSQLHRCNYCSYETSKRYLLTRHLKTHSQERPHRCSVCERGFKTLASLQNHVNTHTGTKPHKCRYCEAGFTTSGLLIRHIRYRHTLEKPHKCTECDYSSVELSKLTRHMRAHTGERPYQCPHCTYASPDTFKLKRHLRIHTGEKPYECDMCHARFSQTNSLKSHRLIHTGNKPLYQCELCPVTCGRKTDLRIHVQNLHMSDGLIKCRRCGKTFPDRHSFKLHSKTHEGEKCFKCHLCPYAASNPRNLESHMFLHTNQKPFECEECHQSFRQKQLLKRHLNLHHNPEYVPPAPRDKTYECPLPSCRRPFRHKGNLMRHMTTHDPGSSAHNTKLALRLGRRKKLGILEDPAHQVLTLEGGDLVQLEGEGADGQKYVVLKVIQMDDKFGTTEPVVIGRPKVERPPVIYEADADRSEEEVDQKPQGPIKAGFQDFEGRSANLDNIEEEDFEDDEQEEEDIKANVQNCFGFDDGEEDEEEYNE